MPLIRAKLAKKGRNTTCTDRTSVYGLFRLALSIYPINSWQRLTKVYLFSAIVHHWMKESTMKWRNRSLNKGIDHWMNQSLIESIIDEGINRWMKKSVKQRTSENVHHWVNRFFDQSINVPRNNQTNRLLYVRKKWNQFMDELTNQGIIQSANPSTDQSINGHLIISPSMNLPTH